MDTDRTPEPAGHRPAPTSTAPGAASSGGS